MTIVCAGRVFFLCELWTTLLVVSIFGVWAKVVTSVIFAVYSYDGVKSLYNVC